MTGEWRPIAKPPGEYETVLIGRVSGKRCTMVGCWSGERWLGFSMVGMLEIADPTHWRPLPEPPTPDPRDDGEK